MVALETLSASGLGISSVSASLLATCLRRCKCSLTGHVGVILMKYVNICNIWLKNHFCCSDFLWFLWTYDHLQGNHLFKWCRWQEKAQDLVGGIHCQGHCCSAAFHQQGKDDFVIIASITQEVFVICSIYASGEGGIGMSSLVFSFSYVQNANYNFHRSAKNLQMTGLPCLLGNMFHCTNQCWLWLSQASPPFILGHTLGMSRMFLNSLNSTCMWGI